MSLCTICGRTNCGLHRGAGIGGEYTPHVMPPSDPDEPIWMSRACPPNCTGTAADPLLDRMAEAVKDTMCFATNDHDVNILPDHQLVTNEELLAEFDARRGK